MPARSWRLWIGLLLVALVLGAGCVPRPASAQIAPTKPRPVKSYLHGPFVLLRMAVQFSHKENGRVVAHVEHLTVRDRAAISQLVRLMNRDRTIQTIIPPCPGGGPGPTPVIGPVWLSFVRADGSKEHAVDYDPCDGYIIRGVRLDDPQGAIYRLLLTLVGGRG
jgi:hypothetical protein